MKKIAILDYGAGNLRSLKKCLSYFAQPIITDDLDIINKCTHIIIPGVGNYDSAINKLTQKNIFNYLCDLSNVKNKKILGICLGMQIMYLSSSEGIKNGLGYFDKKISKINLNNKNILTPHVGWSEVTIEKKSKIYKDFSKNAIFYFNHSYGDINNESKYETSTLILKDQYLVASIEKDNFIGVQFHPEKSQLLGKLLIENFVND